MSREANVIGIPDANSGGDSPDAAPVALHSVSSRLKTYVVVPRARVSGKYRRGISKLGSDSVNFE